ncbi:hypothetical protein C7271_23095 [filamentous cyanobacterium CCP5]|nr:hypothetical protein C7271_23095 [filamentous cyanobacterium CCP5]
MQLDLTLNQLTIQLEWYEQLWAFTLHNQIAIPLAHIVRATTEEPPSRWTDLRAPGTHLPGVIKAGTYYTRQGREFWYATTDQKFLVLELRDEAYQKIVLTPDDHQTWADRISQAKANANGDIP